MKLYLDSAYVAKLYLPEPDSERVRALIGGADSLYSSAWCVAEVCCAVHRHVQEGKLPRTAASAAVRTFLDHIARQGWSLLPVTEEILYGVATSLQSVPAKVFLRAGDAIHLVSAKAAGFSEIWSSDRHLLRAAPHFGLAGRSV